MFLELQLFLFSVITYTVQSIPIGNLEIIWFFLSKGGSGTQFLKAFQTALHATAKIGGKHACMNMHPGDNTIKEVSAETVKTARV